MPNQIASINVIIHLFHYSTGHVPDAAGHLSGRVSYFPLRGPLSLPGAQVYMDLEAEFILEVDTSPDCIMAQEIVSLKFFLDSHSASHTAKIV